MRNEDKILGLISSLGEAENAISKLEIISPIYDQRVIQTRVKGLVCKFAIPKTKPGWYRFKPRNMEKARVSSEAGLEDIEKYLKALPRIRVVAMFKSEDIYYGIPCNNNFGFDVKNTLPIYLASDAVLDFDVVFCRYDGQSFWYETNDPKNDFTKADYLRESYRKMTLTKRIQYPGLMFEEKAAYAFKFEMDKEILEKMKKKDLEDAVSHGGGKMVGYHEYKDHFKVTFKVDDVEYTSTISKDSSHEVLSSGICLSGEDNKFDLKSLVSVFREKQKGITGWSDDDD